MEDERNQVHRSFGFAPCLDVAERELESRASAATTRIAPIRPARPRTSHVLPSGSPHRIDSGPTRARSSCLRLGRAGDGGSGSSLSLSGGGPGRHRGADEARRRPPDRARHGRPRRLPRQPESLARTPRTRSQRCSDPLVDRHTRRTDWQPKLEDNLDSTHAPPQLRRPCSVRNSPDTL